jgi:Zinc dependent phospholipase C
VPTSATHITIVQRIAASDPKYKALLGDPKPTLSEDDPAAVKMRYACLGACGPDIFYAMADYGEDLQELENFLVKIGGTFSCIGDLMGKVSRYVDGVESEITHGVTDSLHQTFSLITSVVREGFLALMVNAGINLWPVFEPARQRDLPRTGWFWADYLHYIRSGRFVRKLLANSASNDNLRAYAFGYLTHYVTDVVGHPYVNQVVRAPWRLYWQRHHLVENFIDAYVWDRWHKALPPPKQPSSDEQPLDRLVTMPNVMGTGAPLTFARLHDWVDVGSIGLGDPVDDIVEGICEKIEQRLFGIGIVERIDPDPPAEADFRAWTELMARTIKQTYDEAPNRRPMNLASGVLPGGVRRPDGYPTADDVAAAYGVFRLVLRLATEETIQPPKPPDIVSDISAAVQTLANDIAANIAAIPPFPTPSTSGGFSLSALLVALQKTAEWAARAAEAIGKAVVDLVKDTIDVAGTGVSDTIKYALYLLNSALFSLYRSLRDVLVLQAYSMPYTEQLAIQMGGLSTSTLWRSSGNPPGGTYPPEEIDAERKKLFSTYSPAVPPSAAAEEPAVFPTAPYAPTFRPGFGRMPIPTLPDDFIDAPLGPDDMFKKTGPAAKAGSRPRRTFDSGKRNFGGAIANSRKGIDLARAGFPGGAVLPDYNLDADRGYAWPCWDVSPAPTGSGTPGDPLNPDDPANLPARVATVDAVAVTG